MFRPSLKSTLLVLSILLIAGYGLFILKYNSSGSQESLGNIDENSDGIWDDVEHSIEANFKKLPTAKKGAVQMGKALQVILNDPSNSREKDKALSKSMSCLVASGLQDGLTIQESAELISKVRDLMLTNSLREERYIAFNVSLNGSMLDELMPDTANCDFKVEGK